MWTTLVVFASVGLFGCGPGGSGGTGDALSEPAQSIYGSGSRLSEIQGSATWLDPANEDSVNCKIPPAGEIFATGVTLTAVDGFDETGSGALGNYYVQDSNAQGVAHSGITVFQPGFSPPDLRLVEGDVIDIFGLFTEFAGPNSSPFDSCKTLPEMSGAIELRFDGSPTEPTLIKAADLGSYEDGRKWLGMLVTIENVKLLDSFEGSGRYSIGMETGLTISSNDIPSISNELVDIKTHFPDLSGGQTIKSVTGIVTFFYDFSVAPRSPADLTL